MWRNFLRALVWASCVVFLSATTAAWSQTFSLSATPQALTIHPGDQNVALTVTASSSSYTGPIVVTLTGLPSGISVSPLVLTEGESGTIDLSASVAADQEDFSSTKIPAANTAKHTVTVSGAAGSVIATTPITLTVSLTNPAFAPEASQINLPVMTINTNGKAVTSKTVDVPATINIMSADGETQYLPNSSDSDNSATIHVHGNSTALMPKLAYEIKLGTSLDLLNTMGLSCPYVTSSGKATCDKSKSYVLLANYDDKSLLRDWSASALANAIPLTSPYLTSPAGSPSPSGTSALMPWAAHSLFVELYLNGVYEGNYQLIEKVNVDSHRVNITEQTATDTDMTGGYLMEIDHHEDEDYVFFTPSPADVPIGMIDPDFSPEVPAQESYISNYVDEAQDALYADDTTATTPEWKTYFDEASAVNFYIVNDVMGNVDGGDFYSSDYFYKDVDNPLIYMGPIWDFDISAGNVNYETIVNPTVPWMQVEAPWYVQWFKYPGFKADVVTQWNLLKNNGVFSTWLASIPVEAATLQQSQANNFGRWPMQGIEVWPNSEAVGSYDGEVQYLTNWLQLRIAWLDAQFNGKTKTMTTFTAPAGTLRNGTSATLATQVTGTGSTAPTGSVSFLSNSVLLGVAALDSAGNASLTTTALPVGKDSLVAVYSGDSVNALSSSRAQTVTVLSPLASTVTSLASSVASIHEDGDADADDTVTFSVSVLGNSGTAVPTGTVSFAANQQALGSTALSSTGAASFPTVNLPGGSDSVQASYNGDSNYEGSTSNAVAVQVTLPVAATPQFTPAAGSYTSVQTVTMTDSTRGATIYYTTDGSTPTAASTPYTTGIMVDTTETVQAIAVAAHYANSSVAMAVYALPPPSFTLAITPSSASIRRAETATFTLTVTPQFDFMQTVSFACLGLPAGEVCSFSPATLTPGSGGTSTLTISAAPDMASLSHNPLRLWTGMGGGMALALLLWPARRRRMLLMGVLLLGIGLGLSGCGGEVKTVVSTVTVTASGGSVTQSQMVSLAVTE